MSAVLLPFPVRSRMTQEDREEFDERHLTQLLDEVPALELSEPAFLATLVPADRARLEESQ